MNHGRVEDGSMRRDSDGELKKSKKQKDHSELKITPGWRGSGGRGPVGEPRWAGRRLPVISWLN